MVVLGRTEVGMGVVGSDVQRAATLQLTAEECGELWSRHTEQVNSRSRSSPALEISISTKIVDGMMREMRPSSTARVRLSRHVGQL